ncbi:hypothetical protein J4447_04945 [Candidatus Pacearchaeota archaeon]|nr:hypothetical protein [Candidatus Pacearchaeota archaeon]
MIIAYDPDLKTQAFFESAHTLRKLGINLPPAVLAQVPLGEIQDPILAFDTAGISNLPNGNLIAHLFQRPDLQVMTSYL